MNPIEISPEQFKSLCEQFLAIASDYLREMDSRSIPAKGSGAEIDRVFRGPLPDPGSRRIAFARPKPARELLGETELHGLLKVETEVS